MFARNPKNSPAPTGELNPDLLEKAFAGDTAARGRYVTERSLDFAVLPEHVRARARFVCEMEYRKIDIGAEMKRILNGDALGPLKVLQPLLRSLVYKCAPFTDATFAELGIAAVRTISGMDRYLAKIDEALPVEKADPMDRIEVSQFVNNDPRSDVIPYVPCFDPTTSLVGSTQARAAARLLGPYLVRARLFTDYLTMSGLPLADEQVKSVIEKKVDDLWDVLNHRIVRGANALMDAHRHGTLAGTDLPWLIARFSDSGTSVRDAMNYLAGKAAREAARAKSLIIAPPQPLPEAPKKPSVEDIIAIAIRSERPDLVADLRAPRMLANAVGKGFCTTSEVCDALSKGGSPQDIVETMRLRAKAARNRPEPAGRSAPAEDPSVTYDRFMRRLAAMERGSEKALVHPITYFNTPESGFTFADWLGEQQKEVRREVEVRLSRVEQGNFGDHHKVHGMPDLGMESGGISELRLDVGKGIRIYYGFASDRRTVVVVWAGTHETQIPDIVEAAKEYRAYRKSIKG